MSYRTTEKELKERIKNMNAMLLDIELIFSCRNGYYAIDYRKTGSSGVRNLITGLTKKDMDIFLSGFYSGIDFLITSYPTIKDIVY